MPEFTEHAVRHHRPARDLGRQRPEFERRASQSGQLRLQGLAGDRVFCGRGGGLFRFDQASPAACHRGLDPQRFARHGGHMQVDGRASPGVRRFEGLAKAGGEMGIVGLPDSLAGLHGGEVDGPVTKRELHLPARHRFGERESV